MLQIKVVRNKISYKKVHECICLFPPTPQTPPPKKARARVCIGTYSITQAMLTAMMSLYVAPYKSCSPGLSIHLGPTHAVLCCVCVYIMCQERTLCMYSPSQERTLNQEQTHSMSAVGFGIRFGLIILQNPGM